MDIDYEGLYLSILAGKQTKDEEDAFFIYEYRNFTPEIIHELLVEYFQVDFGYDDAAWEKHFQSTGGFEAHFFKLGLVDLERLVRNKYGLGPG